MRKEKECVKITCFRFNTEIPEQAKAWEYLHSFDRNKLKSANLAVTTAVNEYFDRQKKLADDPYFENRQREERFVKQIVSEVGKAFIAEMPKFLASLMLSLNRDYPMQAAPIQTVFAGTENSGAYAENSYPSATEGLKTSDEDDFSGIDFDFIGS